MLTHRIIDAQTQEVLEQEITSEMASEVATSLAQYEAFSAQRVEREAARQALLDRLGITADEAKLLLS